MLLSVTVQHLNFAVMSDVSAKTLAVKVITRINIQDIEVLNLVFKIINSAQNAKGLFINIENRGAKCLTYPVEVFYP